MTKRFDILFFLAVVIMKMVIKYISIQKFGKFVYSKTVKLIDVEEKEDKKASLEKTSLQIKNMIITQIHNIRKIIDAN